EHVRRSRFFAIAALVVLSVIGIARWSGAVTNFNVANQSFSWVIDGNGSSPTLTLTRGQTYAFNLGPSVAQGAHAFTIRLAPAGRGGWRGGLERHGGGGGARE